MGISMTEMIDNRLKRFFSEPNLYEISPFDIQDLRNCILMGIIKDAYYETEPKHSLRTNRGSDEPDLRMRDSRSKAYAQHYRKLQYDHIKNDIGIEVPELLFEETETMEGKLSGQNVTAMQYFELNTMADYPIFKAIVNKRICNVKSISNSDFIKYMDEYDKLVESLLSKLDGTDEEVIFATIALFTLEWNYDIEFFYSCAVSAEQAKVKDVPKDRVSALCAELSMLVPPDFDCVLHTESRFILNRRKVVPYIFKDDQTWGEVYDKIYQYLIANYYILREIVIRGDMADYFAKYISREYWAKFIRENYNIKELYNKKEWTNQRIRYVRKLYSVMIKDLEKPST